MAASTTPRPSRRPPRDSGVDRLTAALGSLSSSLPLAVAYSGGADSTALLHACVQMFPGQVAAVHVHHGLQAAADAFEAHCRARCESLAVPLAVVRVDARKRPGESPEDAARRARYRALREAVAERPGGMNCRTVLLAQHADDQVETVLLALLRGAGLAGLSGMRPGWSEAGVAFWRPWLGIEAPAIRQWLSERSIGHVEDPTNEDQAFTRNRIRNQLLPVLEQAFPAFRTTVGRSAAHAAQAQSLLAEVAVLDLAAIRSQEQDGLLIRRLQALARERRANLLRHWLKTCHRTAASAAQLEELLDQIDACTTRGHAIAIRVGEGLVERRGEVLAWYNSMLGHAAVE
jgi:tRNA(Ile)-lysidine synthase